MTQVEDSLRVASTKRYKERLGDREYIVPVLIKALKVTSLLERYPEGLRLDDLSRMTGVSRSTLYRILRTFLATDVLVHCANGAYQIRRAFPGPALVFEDWQNTLDKAGKEPAPACTPSSNPAVRSLGSRLKGHG